MVGGCRRDWLPHLSSCDRVPGAVRWFRRWVHGGGVDDDGPSLAVRTRVKGVHVRSMLGQKLQLCDIAVYEVNEGNAVTVARIGIAARLQQQAEHRSSLR